jgi:PilZ domain
MWEFNIERRASPRRNIKLEFRVLLVATKMSAEGEEQTLPLIGYTRDISESGLALLVSAKSMGVLYSLGQNYTLQLVLTIPTGPIELEVSPVRYKHINEGKSGSFILIGAQITKINDADRKRFVEYLDSFQ